VLATYVIVGTLIGLGETRRVLALTLLTQILNIGFDLFFVLGLGMAGPGVALGTALAEGLGALYAASQLRPALKRWPGAIPWRALRQGYGAFLRVNGDLFLRTLTLLLSLSVFTAQGAGLGTAVVGANALLMNLFMAVSYGLDGIAHGCETLVGQALGRRDLKEARAWVWLALKLAFGGAVASSAVFWAFGPELIALLTDIDGVASTGEAALPWLIALPLLAAGAFIFDGVFIGATQSLVLRNTMLASALLIYAPALLILHSHGNAGLWSALALFFLARSVSLAWVYGRGGLVVPPA
jgi:MATE family multidrug resistance protein